MLRQLGLREDSFFLVPAFLIGIITAAAAVGFHELIDWIRNTLYNSLDPEKLYGIGLPLLIIFPAFGGWLVGFLTRYLSRTREGHGIIDVIESVHRSSGFTRPSSAIEKIITSAITIGTGGSGGAEGPIVQIGAAIASGVGQLFRFARFQMPLLIGCGSAAGISAIFNSPIGGVIFTLEVILQDFSIRTFTPLVVASVIANVTTQAIFSKVEGHPFPAIFAMPSQDAAAGMQLIDWPQLPNFMLLGILCGLAGVTLTRLMGLFEERFARLKQLGIWRPAIGGALTGVLGITYVIIFGRIMLHQAKPFAFAQYPMPAFFGDGYGVLRSLLSAHFYAEMHLDQILLLLCFLCMVKILATCLTLGSGGSGGIIAPSLFIGATAGGFLGALLQTMHLSSATINPQTYALVGMGATLAAVVHAPLASILILLELSQNNSVILPAMLATVFATAIARLIFRDSIYTHSLRARGITWGSGSDIGMLRRLTVEQVPLDPATCLHGTDPAQRVFDLVAQFGNADLVVLDAEGNYRGMVLTQELNFALVQRDALPLMVVDEITRVEVPIFKTSDDLATVFEAFTKFEASHLPVSLPAQPGKVIGLIGRAALMRASQGRVD
ncbi:MAG TPA: chloride channel protein [Tepidisphaeraceae bacterium]|nr:chloride channel protein [Tepidisphaeraceae bacterium]